MCCFSLVAGAVSVGPSRAPCWQSVRCVSWVPWTSWWRPGGGRADPERPASYASLPAEHNRLRPAACVSFSSISACHARTPSRGVLLPTTENSPSESPTRDAPTTDRTSWRLSPRRRSVLREVSPNPRRGWPPRSALVRRPLAIKLSPLPCRTWKRTRSRLAGDRFVRTFPWTVSLCKYNPYGQRTPIGRFSSVVNRDEYRRADPRRRTRHLWPGSSAPLESSIRPRPESF